MIELTAVFRGFAALLIVAIFASCGGKDESPKSSTASLVTMRYGGHEVSFEPTYTRFATFKKDLILKDSDIVKKDERVAAVVHRIYLANYDLQLTDPTRQDHRLIDAEGQYRIEIQIEADKVAEEDSQLQVGEYVYKDQPFNRVSYVFLSYLKEEKDRSENLQGSEFGGRVIIKAVTETEIEGEIDVFDKNEFVKGTFKARRLNR